MISSSPPRSPHAYVTLVTNSEYALGALVLMESVRRTDTSADRVALVTAGVDPSDKDRLAASGVRVVETALLPTSDGFNLRHARRALHDRAPFLKGEKPPFHTPLDNFAKLRLWQMTEYEKVVFLDADTLMLRNCDRLFDYPEFCAAPNVYETLRDFHRMNAGVFTARPSETTFSGMLVKLDQPDQFWRRTDQTFLEHYFPDWHGLPVTYNMLQYVWFNLPDLWDWQSIHIVHYQYEKPWQPNHGKAESLKPLIDLWTSFAEGLDLPALKELVDPE